MVTTWPQVSEQLKTWASRYDVIRRVWIFGSVARGNAGPNSDLDVAVELFDHDAYDSPTDLWFEYVDTWRKDLAVLFSIPVQLELMDTGTKEVINPSISRGGRLVYEHAA